MFEVVAKLPLKRRPSFLGILVPISEGQSGYGRGGENVGVLNLGIHGCLAVGQGRAARKAQQLRGKAHWRRYDGIMDFGKFGMNCF